MLHISRYCEKLNRNVSTCLVRCGCNILPTPAGKDESSNSIEELNMCPRIEGEQKIIRGNIQDLARDNYCPIALSQNREAYCS